MGHDFRAALRGLRGAPGFALAALLTLALGIGANAALFSVVDRMLLRPLPFPEARRLAVVTTYNRMDPERRDNLSGPDFEDYRRGLASFEGLAGFTSHAVNLTGDGEPERLRSARVSAGLFDVLRVPMALGRSFRTEEERSRGAAILTHELWTRRFGADPALVGRTLRMNGEATTVVGILPKGFRFPYQIAGAEVFLPFAFAEGQSRGAHFMGAVGRLKPGVTRAAAEAEMQRQAKVLEAQYPDTNAGFTAKVVDLQEEATSGVRNGLLGLSAALALVLLIACVNVASLTLARGAERSREFAVRLALGADHPHLLRLLLAEAALLGLGGALAGLGLGQVALKGLLAILPLPLGPGTAPWMDGHVLLFTLGLGVACTLLVGVLPGLQLRPDRLADALKAGSKGSAAPEQQRLRRLLVGSEVALAMALLVVTGLTLRSLWKLQQVDPGFQAQNVATAQLSLPTRAYPNSGAQGAFLARLLDRVRALPGVQSAATTSVLPLSGSSLSQGYEVEGEGPLSEAQASGRTALFSDVSPDYFKTLGIPLRQGREFAAGERDVVILSAQFARAHWPEGGAVGRRIRVDGPSGPWLTVIGVAGDVRHEDLARPPLPTFYLPVLDGVADRNPFPSHALAVKVAGDPAAWGAPLRAVIRELDPELPLSRNQPMPMARLLDRSREGAEARTLLFSAFGFLALLLAGLGVYGVTSYLVAQRTREIGIRMALGGQVSDVLGLVLGQGLRTVAAGGAAGLLLAAFLGRGLQQELPFVGALDPLTYAAAALVLALIGTLASLLPALRATRIQPAVAMRSE